MNDVIEAALWGLIGLAMAAPLAFSFALFKRRMVRTWWAFLLWLFAMYLSMGAYSLLGMNYEDFDRPIPFWIIAGIGVAQVGATVAFVGAGRKLWLGWKKKELERSSAASLRSS